jgi:GalNAc-alpha-(1->4)-GalNAc-alpha-(1->3)-diNAcBac-PP-undecaprenol alpha-1,4-N-acetyl-D-galactosaminyltransferase
MNSREKLVVCLVIPSLQAGGMERVMSQLATFFTQVPGTVVHLILYGITREIFYQVPGNVIIHKPSFVFNNKWRTFYTFKTLFFLRRKIKEIRPHTCLSFGEFWNNFFLLSIIGLRCRVYISDRSQPDKSLGRFHELLRHLLYPGAAGLIFQTAKAKEIYLTKNIGRNIAVIGNPMRNIDHGTAKIERQKNVIMVGRLINTKHQDQLIEMFAKVNNPEWNLLIVGYDHLKQLHLDRLKKLAKDLNIEQSVIFTGKQDKIDEIYLKSSIFAFTSSSEGFPNVIGEAMSAGLPVISYDCVAGPSEMIVDGYNGYLIPLFNKTRFESKLALLMKDDELREKLGANARESIKRFSQEKICKDYYDFIIHGI